ncbi:hypothetical protein [Flavivirga jejuensis]|uniref:Uncharacterized protein n=1 Tax=Flavivirga jejuensis TaxID=870487 RepID=A0ABT8WR10_9FLAO|nr:hypothetical protein [Flavivirga jejuensis]MDO5975586.1 hypothetical protein [Flavivirga jejuensis]
MDDKTKVSEEYIDIEAFNQGYEVAKELGLKPDALNGINAGNNRMQSMKEGMEQYHKEVALEKAKTQNKDIIPPFDMDSIDNNYIDLTPDKEDKDKGLDMDI